MLSDLVLASDVVSSFLRFRSWSFMLSWTCATLLCSCSLFPRPMFVVLVVKHVPFCRHAAQLRMAKGFGRGHMIVRCWLVESSSAAWDYISIFSWSWMASSLVLASALSLPLVCSYPPLWPLLSSPSGGKSCGIRRAASSL